MGIIEELEEINRKLAAAAIEIRYTRFNLEKVAKMKGFGEQDMEGFQLRMINSIDRQLKEITNEVERFNSELDRIW